MVLGLKMKNRKSLYIQLDYIVNILEIKPWPPSESLKSLRSALIQWKHGDAHSGSTKPVAPSVVSSSIEFNEAFRVHVTLSRDRSFYLEPHTSPNHRISMATSLPPPTSIISSVDRRYHDELVFSKVESTNTTPSDRFQSSAIEFSGDNEVLITNLEKNMTLSWIMIDPTQISVI
ncbi:hypothetical protein L2E82_32387 [Cichorium intybus]|uniref:Uncharacterized protein n=1 Tax=Cichorium intybus TaxID=13427 RepID=A0ACB9BH30_CICIN|nr:hypothetical protein L2E82_32387 [Cichorium intybus]